MNIPGLPVVVLVGALLSACGTSSVSDLGLGAQGLEPGTAVADGGGERKSAALQADSSKNAPKSEIAVAPKAASTNSGSTVTQAPEALAAKKSAEALTSVATPGNVGYKIGPLDVLDVSVFKVPDLTKAVQVSEAGTINYPLVGEVEAAGKTAREVEHMLTKTLGAKYLQKPQVTVFVKEYNSQRVTIEGAVSKPGVYPIQGGMSLLQAIAIAQGVGPNSDSTVVVFRNTDGKRAAARYDIAEIRTGAAADPRLQAGDVVVAGSSAFKEGLNNVLKVLPLASIFAIL